MKEDTIDNMSFDEALLLSKEAGVQMIIPMHFDLYQVNGLNPSYFVDLLYREFSYLFSWRKICILSLNFFIKKAQKMINHFLRLFIPQFHQ